MAEQHLYKATIEWRRGEGDFSKGRFSRGHRWSFDGGIEVPASASPYVVPLPLSVEAAVDPEEAFVASLSSCHMLTFVDLARRAGFTVDSYEDTAEGVMARLEAGRWWISKVTLRPRIVFSGAKLPDEIDLADLHHKAHDACFISNSVKTEVVVDPYPAG
jgi:organic hydroperoxide reductase OsmC/OhrA